jgi:hypothetical protein
VSALAACTNDAGLSRGFSHDTRHNMEGNVGSPRGCLYRPLVVGATGGLSRGDQAGHRESRIALSAGQSVESTMGFTALDGLPMGTRPGRTIADNSHAQYRVFGQL